MTKQTINYVSGDATAPQGQGVKIIAHICNDIGAWGKGFVLSVSKRWNHPELMYRCWHSGDEQEKFKLGVVQFVQVEPDIWIANMIGQHGISGLKSANALAPIRYDAVEKCLGGVAQKAIGISASVHMPRIGCGLAGGQWSEIEPIIERTLLAAGVEVYVYDL